MTQPLRRGDHTGAPVWCMWHAAVALGYQCPCVGMRWQPTHRLQSITLYFSSSSIFSLIYGAFIRSTSHRLVLHHEWVGKYSKIVLQWIYGFRWMSNEKSVLHVNNFRFLAFGNATYHIHKRTHIMVGLFYFMLIYFQRLILYIAHISFVCRPPLLFLNCRRSCAQLLEFLTYTHIHFRI